MIYEFTLEEKSKTKIPVKANSEEQAWKIFDSWYGDERNASEINDLLDNGYEGQIIMLQKGYPEDSYNLRDVMLPKEEDHYPEPEYCIHIVFKDGSNPYYRYNLNSVDLGKELIDWGANYILIPTRIDIVNGITWLWYTAVNRASEKVNFDPCEDAMINMNKDYSYAEDIKYELGIDHKERNRVARCKKS